MNEKILRFIVLIIAAAIHAAAILFIVFNYNSEIQPVQESARVMKLVDLAEAPPPPPPPPVSRENDIPEVEAIAETMVETDTVPEQRVAAAGTILPTSNTGAAQEYYFRMNEVSQLPRFDERQIAADLVYPPIALRSGVEGRVILELYVDHEGVVQRIIILQETPPDRGFGDAAVKAFTGRKGSPAMANGKPVSARFRWPVSFRIK